MLRSDLEFTWRVEDCRWEEGSQATHSDQQVETRDLMFHLLASHGSSQLSWPDIIRCHTSVCPDSSGIVVSWVQVRDTRELSNRNFSYKFLLFSLLIITPHSTLSFYCFCSELIIFLVSANRLECHRLSQNSLVQINQNQERNMLGGR